MLLPVPHLSSYGLPITNTLIPLQLGKNVEHFKAAAVAADSKNLDPVIKYCAVGRQLGYAGYLSLDALTFLDAANIRKSPNTKRLQQEAYRCWMIGLLFSAVSGAYSLYNLRQQQARIDKKDGEGAIATKRIEKCVNILALSRF